MSRLYLIRHGKTAANEAHLYCGSSDLPLSEAGISGLMELKASYSDVKAEAFYTSGMRRANETLRILFGQGAECYTELTEFREIDFGAFELKSYGELKDEPAYREWISGDNEEKVPPGGESGRQMKERVMKAFGELCAKEQDAVLVTHGGVIAAVMGQLFPHESKNLYQWQPRCGCGYAIDVNENGYGYEELPR